MKKSLILTDFKPIIISKKLNQEQLNQYTKYLYWLSSVASVEQLSYAGDYEDDFKENLALVSSTVDKYAVRYEKINRREILVFEDVATFITKHMKDTAFEEFPVPEYFANIREENFGPKIGDRMEWFKINTKKVFDEFYNDKKAPENVVHVSCSGYSSPSVAQQSVTERGWNETGVTHSYHMGCYGAFPGIRIASGIVQNTDNCGRVDIVHTELLSNHLNLLECTPSNTVICSLFADGFVGYSMYDETSFRLNKAAVNQTGYRIHSAHEMIIPSSLEDMTWDISEFTFVMTLSKKVPLLIKQNINEFVIKLCSKAGINFNKEKENLLFAIHPGGPRIIEYIIEELGLDNEQAKWSHEVLRNNGNMSSATIPYILGEMLQSNEITSGKKIIAMAFGPGLTATGLVLEKI